MGRLFVCFLMLCCAPFSWSEDQSFEELKKALEELRAKERAEKAGDSGSVHVDPTTLTSDMAALLGDALEKDTSAIVSAERMVAGQPQRDASMKMLGEQSRAGTLWVFWAQDAPGSKHLPKLLIQVAELMPDVAVHDVHVMSALAWQKAMGQLHDWKTELEAVDPNRPIEDQIPEKHKLHQKILDEWSGFTRMAETRRDGGYLVMEDVTPAMALKMKSAPTFRYISPSGIVHRLDGINPNVNLVTWIGQCLKWELEHAAKQRELLLK